MKWGEWLTRTAPAWLVRGGTDARVVLEAIGEALDGARDALLLARRVRFVQLAPAALLERHGQLRRLRRYPGESTDAYRERLRAALPIYRQAGRRASILRVLRALGHADASVNELYRLGPALCDGTYACNGEIRCSGAPRRFEYDVVLPSSLTSAELTADQVTLITSECRRWAPAWAALSAIILQLEPETDTVTAASDEAMEVTSRHYRLCDGSFDCDGSVDCDAFETTSEVI